MRINSRLYKFLDTLWNILKLNFIWLLFSLPIVTIGASTVAAFSVTLKMVEDTEGKVIKQFMESFRINWKQGIPMGLIMLFISYCVYINLEIFNKVEGNSVIFLLSAIFIGFIGLAHFLYAFPLCARYDNTIFKTFRNSALITTRYFLRTILLCFILLVLILMFLFNNTLLFFGILIGPASLFLTISAFAIKFFREIEKENK